MEVSVDIAKLFFNYFHRPSGVNTLGSRLNNPAIIESNCWNSDSERSLRIENDARFLEDEPRFSRQIDWNPQNNS